MAKKLKLALNSSIEVNSYTEKLSGQRSLAAIKILLAAGFTSVKYLKKGAAEFF